MAEVTESCRRFPELVRGRLWLTFDGPAEEHQVRAVVYGLLEPGIEIERIAGTIKTQSSEGKEYHNVMVYLNVTGDIDDGPLPEDAGSVHSL